MGHLEFWILNFEFRVSEFKILISAFKFWQVKLGFFCVREKFFSEKFGFFYLCLQDETRLALFNRKFEIILYFCRKNNLCFYERKLGNSNRYKQRGHQRERKNYQWYLIIMQWNNIKLTVGVKKDKMKIQYCITAMS